MTDNSVTGNGPELDAKKVVKKQVDKHYNDPSYFNQVEADAYTPKASDIDADGHKTSQDMSEEYAVKEPETQKLPKKKRDPAHTVPF